MEHHSCNNTIDIFYNIAQISSFDKTHAIIRSCMMNIGENSRGFKYRVLIKFNFIHLPKNAQILRATLAVNVLNAAPENTIHKLISRSLNSDWDICTVNWNNQPSIDYTNILSKCSVESRENYTFDLTTQVRDWYKYPYTNYGLVLMGSEDCCYNKIQICTESGSPNGLSLLVEYIEDIRLTVEPTQFFQHPEDITVSPGIEYFTSTRDISLTKTVSYFIKNNNSALMTAVLEYSPDGINFRKDDFPVQINSGTNSILGTTMFSRYIRLSIKVSPGGNTSIINTWMEIQQ
jgi:hypothetical protein